ncbi:MAG: peptidylprolyl isomerase [Planctomycetes bacterium]|nr:peptidylprolyl isomerase [Planctomycetota bacterium]
MGVRAAADALRGSRLVLETSKGTIVIRLFPDDAPAHCVNVAALAGEGFYDGLTWHRVVADFVIQGGCPRGDGAGNGGVVLPDEIGERPYVRGTVGMPKGNDDTGGCQIFITHLPTPHLDGRYTVFGQVVEGFAVVDAIRIGDRIVKARVELAGQ